MLLAAAAAVGTASAPAVVPSPEPLTFSTFVRTGLPLGGIVWTGERFLYVTERTGVIAASGPSGTGLTTYANLPAEYEETRCALSPGDHGWAPGDLYCHGPHGEIWQVGPDGSVSTLATLPGTTLQDGSLAFDTAGRFSDA